MSLYQVSEQRRCILNVKVKTLQPEPRNLVQQATNHKLIPLRGRNKLYISQAQTEMRPYALEEPASHHIFPSTQKF
jgi:hypothetical protein